MNNIIWLRSGKALVDAYPRSIPFCRPLKRANLPPAPRRCLDKPNDQALHQEATYPELHRSVNIAQLQSGRFATRRYRNRRIGEFVKELSLTEGRGTGIPKMLKAMQQNGSFSKIIGLGNRLNVDFPDILAYLMEDPDTRVILLYVE